MDEKETGIMKRLMKYLNPYKKECILAPLFKMLEAAFELFVPLVVAAVIDKGIGQKNSAYIYGGCGILIGLGLIGLVSAVTAQYFAAKAAVGFSTELRHDLFKHLLGLSFSEIDTLGTSTMITRMTSDVNQAQTGVNMFLRLFLRSPFVVFGAMIMAFTINYRIAFIFAGVIVLLFLAVGLIMKINIPALMKVQKRLDIIMGLTRENMSGVRVIRAFCKEQDEISKFKQENDFLSVEQRRAGWVSAILNPVTFVMVNIAIVRLVWIGAIQVNTGTLTQGQVVALYNYMSQILVELIKLANLIITINRALASANRIADVFSLEEQGQTVKTDSTKEEFENAVTELTPQVEFSHVSLRYHTSGDEALTDISFSAKKGEVIGIIGGTGSGKSSVVNLIPGFYAASAGEVRIAGKNVTMYEKKELLGKIGMVMQKAVLFKGTIEDNLKWGNEAAENEDLEAAVKDAAAEDVVLAKGGMHGMISHGGRNLSGGQRQRLTIARAFVRKPEILILDDSASALDFATDAKLRHAISKLPYHPTVFVVSQRASSVRHADRILVLDDGKLVGNGTHEQLLKTCAVYQEIYASQYRKEASVSCS